jgi:hypothetical protein
MSTEANDGGDTSGGENIVVTEESEDGTDKRVVVSAPEGAVDAERLEGALSQDAEVRSLQGQTDEGTTIPVASQRRYDLSNRYFSRTELEHDKIDDERIRELRRHDIRYNELIGEWILETDDLIPAIKERVISLILGEEGLEVSPEDPDSDADNKLAEHLRDLYEGNLSEEPEVEPRKVIDSILSQNIKNARAVLRASDLSHLDVTTLDYVQDAETGEEIYIQRQTSYNTFQVDEDEGDVELERERTDTTALEIGSDVFEAKLYDRPPLRAIAGDVVGKQELKQLKARKAKIASFGGIYIRVKPPEWLPEEQYFDKVQNPFNDERDKITKLEKNLRQGINSAMDTLDGYKSGTIMAVPSNWEVEQIELPEQNETIDEQIRGYNQAISRRLLFPLDLVELREGAELSRETIFKTLINTIQGWRQELLTVFDAYADVQKDIHGLSGSVTHSFPRIDSEDATELIKSLKHAALAGMSEDEVRQVLNKIDGIDLNIDEGQDSPEVPDAPEDEGEEGGSSMPPEAGREMPPEEREGEIETFLEDYGDDATVEATTFNGYPTAREAAAHARNIAEKATPDGYTAQIQRDGEDKFIVRVFDGSGNFDGSFKVSRSSVDADEWKIIGTDDYFREKRGELAPAMSASEGGEIVDIEAERRKLQAAYASGMLESQDAEEIEERRQEFNDLVNMSPSEIRDFGEHACSGMASQEEDGGDGDERVRQRVIDLLETPADEWGGAEYSAAGQVISFISRMLGNDRGDPVPGDECDLARRDISLMNWGYRPDGVDLR